MKALACIVVFFASAFAPIFAASGVTIVANTNLGPASRHGLAQLEAALQGKGLRLGRDAAFITAAIGSNAAAESFSIRLNSSGGRSLLHIEGADDRGLMYGLLEAADRISWATNADAPFSEIRDLTESPDVSDRAVSIYTFHRATFEERFHDEAYWTRYFDMLARHRFNSFVLIFGYENGGFFAPAYPWFFDVEGFPGVSVPNVSREQQEKNFRALSRMIALAHDRGLRFSVGLWDHIYRGGIQSGEMANADPDKPGPDRVTGLTQTNLLPYSRAALAKFLKMFPGIDGLQFRMHNESGLRPGGEQHAFWKATFEVVKQERPALPLTLRAKGLPDEIIELALGQGLNVRVATKYWMEQVGLPFHPTHIPKQNQHDRRHGYADLLRYPQRYRMHWRLWSAGTIRTLLWGDPEFARRFAASTHLYDGDGFEITEPLGTKMQAQPHDQEPFALLNPAYRYYDYEFERYWHFFQVFGRMAYNPQTPPEVWQREFERRFGPEAAPYIEKALHRASGILPRITATTFPYRLFPTTRGWAEKQRWCDLPEYAKVIEGSDTEQFQGIDEAARCILEGIESAKLSPEKNSRWFQETSEEVLKAVDEAERRIGTHRSREFDSTIVDLRILGYLGQYHSLRIRSGLEYALFKRSGDVNSLELAITYEYEAVEAWEWIVEAAGEAYAENLLMGRCHIDLCGHWRDEESLLREGLGLLEDEHRLFTPAITNRPFIGHAPIRRASGGPETFRATVTSPQPIKSVKLLLRSGPTNHTEHPLKPAGPFTYEASVPENLLGNGAAYSIVAEDFHGTKWSAPANSVFRIFPAGDTTPPEVTQNPPKRTRRGQPLRITIEAHDPSGIKWVRLRYRAVNQMLDYETIRMLPTGQKDEYQTTIAPEKIHPRFDLMYFIEVMDNAGNGKIYPDFEKETPYVVVKLER